MTDNRSSPLFSTLPRNEQLLDAQGKLDPNWSISLHSLSRTLQSVLTREGFRTPRLSATDIASIATLYNQKLGTLPAPFPVGLIDISGTQIYDSTNFVPKIFIITYNVLNQITFAGWKTYTLA